MSELPREHARVSRVAPQQCAAVALRERLPRRRRRLPQCRTAQLSIKSAPQLFHELVHVVRERTQHLQAAVRDEPKLGVDDRAVAAADEQLPKT